MSYSKKIPKYFPHIHSFLKLDFIDYLPLKWRWIKKEFISLLAVISVTIAIETWEDVKFSGRAEYAKGLSELFLIIIFYFVILFLLYAKRKPLNKTMS